MGEEESDMHHDDELGLVRFCGPLDPLTLSWPTTKFDLLFHEQCKQASKR